MKVTKVTPFVLEIPVSARNHLEAKQKGLAGVRLETDAGLVGTGFTGPHSWGSELFARAMQGPFSDLLLGADPRGVVGIWDQLHNSKTHGLGRAGIVSRAHAAIDIALWDLKAQHSAQPLWKLLGAHKVKAIDTYLTVGGLDWPLDQLTQAVGALLDEGWRMVKVKVGRPNVQEDILRLREVRRALGPGFELCVDANHRWSTNQALEFVSRAEDLALRWLEEPCAVEDVRAHAELARRSRIPIAIGESLHSRHDFLNFVRAEAVGYLQADATQLSGITEWLAVAGLADCYGLPMVPHHADFGQVHQHLVAGARAGTMLEFPWSTSIFVEPLRHENFRIVLPTAPGAGTAIDNVAFERYRVF